MGFPIEARAEWSADHESSAPQVLAQRVADAEDLEGLLDRLSSEAAGSEPFVLDLVASTGARLGVGLGASSGSVLSFKESDDPPYYMSSGETALTGERDVGFYYQGHWSEFPEEAVVPVELAWRAAQQFLASGERPDAVDWEEV